MTSLLSRTTRHLRSLSCFSSSTATRRLSSQDAVATPKRKRLDVAIVGAPNAGKSQLLNVLTQSPVAAVSRKRHTTQSQDILGVRTLNDTQIVFQDTPGYLTATATAASLSAEKLDASLKHNSVTDLEDVDFTLVVVDAAKRLTSNDKDSLQQLMRYALQSEGRIEEDYLEDDEDENDEHILKDEHDVAAGPRPKFAIVLNKCDLVKPKSDLLDVAMEIGELADSCLLETGAMSGNDDFDTLLKISPICFYISALKQSGTDDLLQYMVDMATPCRVWAVEDGKASTTMSPEEQIQELIREKIYRCLHREVPHSIHQINRLYRKLPQGVIIHQDLVVFKASHQKLVHGRTLQRIEDAATRDLKALFGCDVLLKINVKLNRSKQRRNATDLAIASNNEQVFTQL